MSVLIDFYTNNSPANKANKSLDLIASKSCELKGDVSIQTPTLIVSGDAATFASCNYFAIGAFNRLYFLTSCVSLPGGLLEITGDCDVLTSAWALGLAAKEAVIARQEEDFNLYLNDGTFQAYANDSVVTKEFSAGFTTPSYVLVVAG